LTLSNLKLLRRITRTENILHRNFTRRQVAIQNRVASNIGISQSTFSVKVLNLFSRSRRKTNKRKSKHSAMLRRSEERFSRNAETDLVCRLLLEKKTTGWEVLEFARNRYISLVIKTSIHRLYSECTGRSKAYPT